MPIGRDRLRKYGKRAGFAGGVEADNTPELKEIQLAPSTDYDECLACQ